MDREICFAVSGSGAARHALMPFYRAAINSVLDDCSADVVLRASQTGKSKSGRSYKLALMCSDPATNVSAFKAVAVTVPGVPAN